jgi:site-specific DNA-methyltransferase (adenine-specific)
MIPYYAEHGITLYHGDCRDVLPTLPAASVDLIVTDPPYGVRWQSQYRRLAFDAIVGDDSTAAAVGALRLALGTLRKRRHVYVFGRYDWSDLPLASPVELIWDKDALGMGDLAIPWAGQHEYIQFAVYFPSTADRDNDRGRLTARLRQGTILRVTRLTGNAVTDHPTEKPVALLRQLIESSSCIGETVLDMFAGVGSTLVAARVEGRRAIGIELDERYCEIAARRLAQNVFAFSEPA